MTHEIITTEAIVLKSLEFKEYDKILTLLSPDFGLFSLYVKMGKKKHMQAHALVTPFTRAEYQFTRGRTDLFRFHDGSTLDQHLCLRKSYKTITTAAKMVGAICSSQLPHTEDPALYQLFRVLLGHLTKSEDPAPLLALFYLKLLKHGGTWQEGDCCQRCDKRVEQEFYRFGGELFCQHCAPPPSTIFNSQEHRALGQLCHLTNLALLEGFASPGDLHQKITSLFESCYIFN